MIEIKILTFTLLSLALFFTYALVAQLLLLHGCVMQRVKYEVGFLQMMIPAVLWAGFYMVVTYVEKT